MNNHVHLHVCILCTFTLHTYIHTDMCLDVTNFVHETLTERSSKTVRQYVQTPDQQCDRYKQARDGLLNTTTIRVKMPRAFPIKDI